MTRKKLMIIGGLVVVLLGAGIVFAVRPRSAVTWENFANLKVGMNESEVEAIFGRPADVTEEDSQRSVVTRIWVDSGIAAFVTLDQLGVVTETYAVPRQTVLGRMRRWWNTQ